MPQYLFGFQTHNINEAGTLIAAGSGEEVLKATSASVGKFLKLMTLTNPEMIPAYIPEPPKAVAARPVEAEPISTVKQETKKRK